MSKLNLGENEQIILAAASTIFSGLAANTNITKKNHQLAIRFSLHIALKMAREIDVPNMIQNLEKGETPFPW